LKPEDERRLGRELHKLIMKYNRPVETGAYDQRIEDAARPLLAKRTRKDIDYTFTVLDSPVVNAFSHPGGYIYVNEGLFNLIGEDEDYALEFVLGHEIAHVDLKHAIQCIEGGNAEEKKRGLGTLPQFYLLIAFGYPDKMVAEADAWAFRRMVLDLDRSRHDALAFLRKFEGYARQNGFAAGRKLPAEKGANPGETPPSMVDNHFRALTAARRRLGDLKALSDTIKTPRK
jgi:predicted Zn-dependent protease